MDNITDLYEEKLLDMLNLLEEYNGIHTASDEKLKQLKNFQQEIANYDDMIADFPLIQDEICKMIDNLKFASNISTQLNTVKQLQSFIDDNVSDGLRAYLSHINGSTKYAQKVSWIRSNISGYEKELTFGSATALLQKMNDVPDILRRYKKEYDGESKRDKDLTINIIWIIVTIGLIFIPVGWLLSVISGIIFYHVRIKKKK
jgi:hypothetical protein